ncbi:MAG: hypothetical protein ACLRM8_04485 [Alistipes sp.]
MDAEYAFYPAETDCIRLTIATAAIRPSISTDYTVCRFQTAGGNTAGRRMGPLLIGIGRPQFPSPATPGRRRVRLRLHGAAPHLSVRIRPLPHLQNVTENPRRDYLLTAEFTVTPFVPFTRFAEPAEGQDIQF